MKIIDVNHAAKRQATIIPMAFAIWRSITESSSREGQNLSKPLGLGARHTPQAWPPRCGLAQRAAEEPRHFKRLLLADDPGRLLRVVGLVRAHAGKQRPDFSIDEAVVFVPASRPTRDYAETACKLGTVHGLMYRRLMPKALGVSRGARSIPDESRNAGGRELRGGRSSARLHCLVRQRFVRQSCASRAPVSTDLGALTRTSTDGRAGARAPRKPAWRLAISHG
jgi:hypothetical protein